MPLQPDDASDLITAYLEQDRTDPDQHRRISATTGADRVLPSAAPAMPGSKRSLSPMSLQSEATQDTVPTTTSIAPLQDINPVHDKQSYQPIQGDDPRSFDLVEPRTKQERSYSLEDRVVLLLSKKHLCTIFADARLFLKFTTFLSDHRPKSIPLLVYYLDTTKALKAIAYSNAILDGLEAVPFVDFTSNAPKDTVNEVLKRNASEAFAILAQEDLPAYITHIFVGLVSTSLHKKITGTMTPQLREASEGLAEVFCITDMSKPDNPVIFTSEEFHRTTQYSSRYAVGRNCRFLQGPYTDMFSTRRIKDAIRNGHDHQDILLNHRRDGSPFLNLLTLAPLLDDHGKVRYFIGAQVDVSGLVRNCTNLEALARLVDNQDHGSDTRTKDKKDEFQHLCEMFNHSELETVRLHGGSMHTERHSDGGSDSFSRGASTKPRLLIREVSQEGGFAGARYSTFGSTVSVDAPPRLPPSPGGGSLPGIFTHYLILRPHPSLRITFTSPSMRIPGLLQSPFLSRIGGSRRVREELALALAEGRKGTAKVWWLTERTNEDDNDSHDEYFMGSPQSMSKTRWIHCTPLLGTARAIGAWVVIMVDSEDGSTKMGHNERTGIVNTNGSKQASLNHENLTQKPSGNKLDEQTQHIPAHIKALSGNGSDWNLDLDIAASESIPPLSPSTNSFAGDTIGASSSVQRRDFSRSFPLAPSPPPTTSIPPVPGIREILRSTTPRSASLKARSKAAAGGYSPIPQDGVSIAFNLHPTVHHPSQSPFPFNTVQNTMSATTQTNKTSTPRPNTPSNLPPPPTDDLPPLPKSRVSFEQLSPVLGRSYAGSINEGKVSNDDGSPGKKRGFAHRMLHGFKKTGAAIGAVVDRDRDRGE